MTTNWAGNITFTGRLAEPTSIAELQRLLADARRARVLGSGHSFNRIADTTGALISLARLPQVRELDAVAGTIRIDGAARYADVAVALRESGWALPNSASLPHISVAGACATGTHGSGLGNQVLPAGVREVTLATGTGELMTLDRTDPRWPGVPLSLGRLGAVVELVLDLVPAFEIAQTVIEDVPEDVVAAELAAVLGAAYSVSVFTDWGAPARVQVWVKERSGPDGWAGEPSWSGRAAAQQRHMIAGMPTEFTTAQGGVPGPWDERLPHFRADFLPSSGDELQSEYLLPIEAATEAWARLAAVRDRIADVLQICEVRAVAGDDLWLSPTAGRASVAFHFTWISDADRVAPAVRAVEDAFAGLDARPHWGKVFTMTPRLDPDVVAAFTGLVDDLDPTGTFGNDLVDGWLSSENRRP